MAIEYRTETDASQKEQMSTTLNCRYCQKSQHLSMPGSSAAGAVSYEGFGVVNRFTQCSNANVGGAEAKVGWNVDHPGC